MNSFIKAKKEEKKSSKCETTVKPTEKKEEPKTSSGFTYKDFQKSINEKESKSKTSFPEELPKEVKLPLPIQTNPNSSLVVEKKDNEKLNEKLANEELEKEKKKEKEKEKKKEKKTKDDYEEETESESESDIEFESDDDDDDDDEYKIVKIRLIPFIFTEKYEQVKGFIKDSRITCYSFLNVINNGMMPNNEFKEIESRIENKLLEILHQNDIDSSHCIKLKINKDNDSRFTFEYYVKIYKEYFNDCFLDDKDEIIICTKQRYQKYYKDTYKKEYDAKKDFFDYFKYLKDFLRIYLKIIYGYRYYSDEVSTIIDKYFTVNRVNPFTYNENIIPFKEIRTKSKDVIKTTIMKMGFIFDDIREIKKE